MAPYRILTVCTGNICRSPMAEVLLQTAFTPETHQESHDVAVDSAAITSWEDGRPMDSRAFQSLKDHGLSPEAYRQAEAHRARKISPEDFHSYDLILAMDTDHLEWLQENAPNRQAQQKIRLIREFDPPAAAGQLGIADPWYGDASDFEQTYQLITAAVPGVVNFVTAAERE